MSNVKEVSFETLTNNAVTHADMKKFVKENEGKPSVYSGSIKAKWFKNVESYGKLYAYYVLIQDAAAQGWVEIDGKYAGADRLFKALEVVKIPQMQILANCEKLVIPAVARKALVPAVGVEGDADFVAELPEIAAKSASPVLKELIITFEKGKIKSIS